MVKLLLEAGVEPIRDIDGVVQLHWPPEAGVAEEVTAEYAARRRAADDWDDLDEPDPIHLQHPAFPIRSPQTASLILLFLDQRGHCSLTARELKQTAMILEGRALRRPVALDLTDALLQSPVLEAVLALLDEHPEGWKGTATGLLATLHELGKTVPLHCLKSPEWPRRAQSFAAELKRVEPWLKDAGVKLRHHRTNRGRHMILRLADSAKADRGVAMPVGEAEARVRRNESNEEVSVAPDAVQTGNGMEKPADDRELNGDHDFQRDAAAPSLSADAPRCADEITGASLGVARKRGQTPWGVDAGDCKAQLTGSQTPFSGAAVEGSEIGSTESPPARRPDETPLAQPFSSHAAQFGSPASSASPQSSAFPAVRGKGGDDR